LVGGAGDDRLEGSPQHDVLVDVGDRGSRDVITCNGGADVTQGDNNDTLPGCARSAFDALWRVKYFWRASALGSAFPRGCA
jgi:hypothetical protein